MGGYHWIPSSSVYSPCDYQLNMLTFQIDYGNVLLRRSENSRKLPGREWRIVALVVRLWH